VPAAVYEATFAIDPLVVPVPHAIRATVPTPDAAFGIEIRRGGGILFLAGSEGLGMVRVDFWEKPGCGGNARQKARLRSCGHVVVEHDLIAEPWTVDRLAVFFADLPPAAWFNRAAPRVKSGEIVPEALDAATAMTLLVGDPLLIRRPLMRTEDGRHLVGFDETVVAAAIGLDPPPVTGPVGEGCPKGDAPHPPCPAPGA
jgi:nitrogenase-associated protein